MSATAPLPPTTERETTSHAERAAEWGLWLVQAGHFLRTGATDEAIARARRVYDETGAVLADAAALDADQRASVQRMRGRSKRDLARLRWLHAVARARVVARSDAYYARERGDGRRARADGTPRPRGGPA
ncbi:MAG: hypothetical protein AB7S26_37890 [Sandaracinaceae bacterium]